MKKIFRHIKQLKSLQKWALVVFVFMGIFHNFLCNENYIIGKTENGLAFFANEKKASSGISAPIPYSYSTIDNKNRKVGPFSKQDVSSLYYRHWLGTDPLGRDVLAGILNGSNVALLVGFVTIILSLLIGLPLGFLSGYYGNTGLLIKKRYFYLWWPILFITWFYGFYSSGYIKVFFFILPFIILSLMVRGNKRMGVNYKAFPTDTFVFRLVEIMTTIPPLFLILMFLTLIIKPSLWYVILIIAFLRWPSVVRHLRAEIFKIKEEDYIIAAKSIGQSDWKIFWHHLLPMSASPLIILSAFGFATAVLIESTLSFLGIGLPVDLVTWGSLIRDARFNFDAWWLAIFPGLMIYIVIKLFNSIGDSIANDLKRS